MKNEIIIQARAYLVTVRDERTGTERAEEIVLDKAQLRAMDTVRQSSTQLIYQLYNRQGFRVLNIGKPVKREIRVDLTELYHRSV